MVCEIVTPLGDYFSRGLIQEHVDELTLLLVGHARQDRKARPIPSGLSIVLS